jgi:hypothetical protein
MRENHVDHEVGGLLDVEHGKPQAPQRNPAHASGGGSA